MNFRRTILITLPLLLSSSLAPADEARPPEGSTTTSAKKKTETTKKSETTKQKKQPSKGAAGGTSVTVGGTKIENKDSDLDMSVSQTKTTSAEQPPKDVAESRAEEVREGQGKRWSVAPLLGYGTGRLNFGMGARAGYTFETPVYVGATFMYHFGDDGFASGQGVSESSRSFYYPAAEVGYDVGIGPVLVRPYAGAGILFNRTSITTNGVSDSVTNSELMIYPGVTAQYILPKTPVFVGGDMRAVLPIEGEAASFSLFATAGLKM